MSGTRNSTGTEAGSSQVDRLEKKATLVIARDARKY